MNGSPFGIEFYQLPDTSIITRRPRTTKFSLCKYPHYIDVYSKNKEFIPGPKYETITNWKDVIKGSKGAFPKNDRITFTQAII